MFIRHVYGLCMGGTVLYKFDILNKVKLGKGKICLHMLTLTHTNAFTPEIYNVMKYLTEIIMPYKAYIALSVSVQTNELIDIK